MGAFKTDFFKPDDFDDLNMTKMSKKSSKMTVEV